ncbi:MAG TPA: MFS transporter [Streptosporangiaceae bacterium]
MTDVTAQPAGRIRLGAPQGRWVLAATVLGLSMVLLDTTVVNVALPTIGRSLHASLAGLQWTVTAYTLTLAGLILIGGSLGDRLGRRRIFLTGVAWFALASALCGLAPATGVLIAARALQGIGGALLTPGSLAIIQASFVSDDRSRAIGAWSGLGAIGGAAGPFLGGWIVGAFGWRWIFFLNLPLAAAVVLVALRHVPETRDTSARGKFDVAGALLAALALTGIADALIEVPAQGLAGALPIGAAGAVVGVGFVLLERRRERSPGRAAPMLPLSVFASRQFTAVNVVTFVIYAALGGMLFLLILNLQVVSGFSPLAAGASLLPMTLLMLTLSPRAGALAQRVGPRWLMAGGPLVSSVGLLLATRIGPNASYAADVLPAIAVFGLGMSWTVAPLTATVLASADVRHAGVASGVNNAVARAASLLAVAGLPLAVGLSGADYHNPAVLHGAFQAAMVICAGLLVAGAVLSAATIDTNVLHPAEGHEVAEPEARTSCPIASPPLEPGEQAHAG